MISFYVTSFRTLGGWAWRARIWAHTHPRLSRVVAVLVLLVFFSTRAQAAHAAGATFLPEGSDYVDSSGNKFSQYSTIDINEGDPLHPGIVIVNFFVQLIWALQYFATGVMLWLFDFLLSFTWVEWLATPFNTLAIWLQGVLTDINWIPFALMISALVGGIAIFVGRVAGGLWEMVMAAVIAVLATGMLANPVATLTAADGMLDKAQQFGGELASSIVVDRSMLGQSQATMSDAVTTNLMDIFVRTPYMVISYSMVLPENCQPYFDTFIQTGEPQASLTACAPEIAKFSYENPGAMNILNALVNAGGVSVLNTFGLVIAVLMVIAVFFFLVAAIKSMFFAYLAIAPISREPLWKAVADSFMGLISLVVMTVLLSLYLKLTAWIMGQSEYLPHQLRMVLLIIFMIVMIVLVIRARKATLRSGRVAASQLSKLGLGMQSMPKDSNALLKMAAVTQMAKSGYDLLSRSPKTMSAPAAAPAAVSAPKPNAPAPVSLDGPAAIGADRGPVTFTQVPDPARPSGPGGSSPAAPQKRPALARKAVATGQAALTIGKGAAAGGIAGAATAAGGLVVKGAVGKAASAGATKIAKKSSADIGELRVVQVKESTPVQNRFHVDSTGAASVRREPKVQDISSLPPRQAPAPSQRALERRRELESFRAPENVVA